MSKQFDIIGWMNEEGYKKFAKIIEQLEPNEQEAFSSVFLRQGLGIFHLVRKWQGQLHTVEDVRAKLQNWIERNILLESELIVDPSDSDSSSQVHSLNP